MGPFSSGLEFVLAMGELGTGRGILWMPTLPLSHILAAALMLAAANHATTPMQRVLYTDKQDIRDTPVPHPLNWWTKNPLRLDVSGDLMIGQKAEDGHIVTAADYALTQNVKRLGEIAGYRILQVDTKIDRGDPDNSSWWKSLLVEVGRGKYVEIYGLQSDFLVVGEGHNFWSAGIYGSGPDAILGTYDSDGGNGGGCRDGYWWFDRAGAHPVDFKPLYRAINRVIPKGSTYISGCWTMHPREGYFESLVQSDDARCHACGYMGTVHASFQIRHGVAIPGTVQFK
jgi:hypothetical protein